MTQQLIETPEPGEVWPGQGGIFGGTVPGGENGQGYHMVFGPVIGQYAWGPVLEEAPADSLIDGVKNSVALSEAASEYPEAEACIAYTKDGHHDFCLPSVNELRESRMALGHQFWGTLWTSTQRSKHDAFLFRFEDAIQGSILKTAIFPVRPMRKVPLYA